MASFTPVQTRNTCWIHIELNKSKIWNNKLVSKWFHEMFSYLLSETLTLFETCINSLLMLDGYRVVLGGQYFAAGLCFCRNWKHKASPLSRGHRSCRPSSYRSLCYLSCPHIWDNCSRLRSPGWFCHCWRCRWSRLCCCCCVWWWWWWLG